jgi:hypothetical protein
MIPLWSLMSAWRKCSRLRSKQLDDDDANTEQLLTTSRQNAKPFALDDAQLGFVIGGSPIGSCIEMSSPRGVGVFFATDGFGLTTVPFVLSRFAPVEDRHANIPALATFCDGFVVEERCLQRSDNNHRALLRSGDHRSTSDNRHA